MVLIKQGQHLLAGAAGTVHRRDHHGAGQHRLCLRRSDTRFPKSIAKTTPSASTSWSSPGRACTCVGSSSRAIPARPMRCCVARCASSRAPGIRRPRSTAPRSACSAWASSRPSRSRRPVVAGQRPGRRGDQGQGTQLGQLRVRPGLLAECRPRRQHPVAAEQLPRHRQPRLDRADDNDYSTSFNFSYLDPYFTDNGVSVGYNLMYSDYNQSTTTTARYGSGNAAGEVTFGLPLSEDTSISSFVRHLQEPGHHLRRFDAAAGHQLPGPDHGRPCTRPAATASQAATTTTIRPRHPPMTTASPAWIRMSASPAERASGPSTAGPRASAGSWIRAMISCSRAAACSTGSSAKSPCRAATSSGSGSATTSSTTGSSPAG